MKRATLRPWLHNKHKEGKYNEKIGKKISISFYFSLEKNRGKSCYLVFLVYLSFNSVNMFYFLICTAYFHAGK